jgi:hypothetical protein
MIVERGTLKAGTKYMIEEVNGKYRVFIGSIYRTTKKTLKGAQGVVSKIGLN